MEAELEKDTLYKQIRAIFSKARILTREESDQAALKMAVYRKKYGQAALNKKLFKEFGLE